MGNSTIIVVVLAIIVILAVAAAVWFYIQKTRTQRLRAKFGPEYNRAVREAGDTKHAEQLLDQRQKRVEKLDIKPLSARQRDDFDAAWKLEQAHFVDEPGMAVDNADRLVRQAMEARGYPVANFEQRVADVSVDHPTVVENYRIAHAIALQRQNGEASTEELREAMIRYRALFAVLLEIGEPQPVTQETKKQATKARRVG
jgi:hypothetical protein